MTDAPTPFDGTFTRLVGPEGTRFREIRKFPLLDSTNRYLKDAALNGEREGLVAIADQQTAGRGRRGRMWDDKPGASILLSVLLQPRDVSVPQLSAYAVALAVTDACKLTAGVVARLKWPNDVIIETPHATRKLAGVLSELVTLDRDRSAVVVGVGINVNWAGELPPALRKTAISLDEAAGEPVDREIFTTSLLRAIHERLARPSWLMQSYRERCATLGQHVEITIDESKMAGVVREIDDSGAIVLQFDEGGTRTLHVGDITHLRPAP